MGNDFGDPGATGGGSHVYLLACTGRTLVRDVLGGTAGDSAHGFDALVSTGKLMVAADAAAPFTVRIVGLSASNAPGVVTNFDRARDYAWPLATFAPPAGTTNWDLSAYGHVEARLKLPHAPGLWPAFWMMPDRGIAAGLQWVRQSTYNGGMECDIMEFLSRWGIYRYNIAMHWNGYTTDHQQTGSSCTYVAPDTNGFITCGLLGTPGSVVYLCNGVVVAQWDSPRVSSVPSNMIFDMVSGGWDNDALDNAQLPDDLVIDYVRCWQRDDLASAVDGVQSTQPTPYAP